MGSKYTPDSVTFDAYQDFSCEAKNDLSERRAYEMKAEVPF